MRKDDILYDMAAVSNLFFEKKFDEHGSSVKTWIFPAVGAVIGAAAALLSFAMIILFGAGPAGVAAAVIFPLIYEAATGWKCLYAMTTFCTGKMNGHTTEEAFRMSSVPEQTPASIIFLASIYLIRMTGFGLLTAAGVPGWYVFVFAGAFYLRGETLSAHGMTSDAVLPCPDEKRHTGFIIAVCATAAACLLSFSLRMLAGGVIAVLALYGLSVVLRKFVPDIFGRASMRMTEIIGYSAEIILMLLGLVLFRL